MVAAATPMAPQAVPHDFKWEIQDTVENANDGNARARGRAHMLEFNVAEPPLREYLPALPWADVPGQARVRLPYIAAACFTWAVLVLHDTC